MLLHGIFIVLLGTAPDAPKTAPAVLLEIVDRDAGGALVTRRADVKVDKNGRRLSNRVYDGRGKLIATEHFRYDRRGQMISREYRTAGGQVKWKWTNLKHHANGEPLTCDIVNKKGKNIGFNRWTYDEQGRMTRRDRLESSRQVRFYYSDIRYDDQGNFATWEKYDATNRKLGSKTWKFATAERP